MKRKLYSIFLALSVFFVSSCELDLLDDPNAVTNETANPSFVLNRIQTDYAALFNTASTFGMRLTRIMSQPNNLYEQAYVPVTFNGLWTNSYANILNDIQFLEDLNERNPIPQHLGIARTIKALVLMHLVDHFDEVPFSEALNPAIFNPLVDPGEQVYAASLTAIQQAREAFGQSSAFVPTDFFYGNSRAKWLKLLNTLEVRYHLNRKLVDPNGARTEINRLIATGELLAEGDDFVFRYGTSQTNPDSRHPRYSQYGQGGGDYQSTWYMFHLTEAKGFTDPRARFYIYRQVNENPTDPDKLRCISEIAPSHYLAGGWPFCLPNMIDGRGYWGRDHLNAEGIPPDNFDQSVYGLYPAGGRFDDDSASPVDSPTLGNGGAGIQPIMLASFLDFMLAEAAQTIGTTGDPKMLLESAIRKHMAYVREFGLSSAEGGVIQAFRPDAVWTSNVENYVTFVLAEWDAAPSGRKMNLIAREYWLSLYGNGVEAYNLYRRTGQPDNMQPGLLANFGDFPRSFFYPNNFIVTNNRAQQKDNQRQRVFWDTNPEGNDWVY